MPIPDFQSLMLPVLEALADGRERLMRDVTAQLADLFELTEEERQRVSDALQKMARDATGRPVASSAEATPTAVPTATPDPGATVQG